MAQVTTSGDLPTTETTTEGPNGSKVRVVNGGKWTSRDYVPDAEMPTSSNLPKNPGGKGGQDWSR